MNSGAALKLTTARYFTPSGRSIQAEGITPDIELEPLKVSAVEPETTTRIKEADLAGHLENGDETEEDSGVTKDSIEKQIATKDYQLYEALNMLKGLAIFAR